MEKFTITVTTAFGIEAITKREIANLGIEVGPAINGRITFTGTMQDVARLNMFLRTGERVLIKIAEFTALSFDELYDNIYNINWQNIITKNGFIHIVAKSHNSKLFALSSTQSITKKAIIDKMKEGYKTVILSETGSEYLIEIAIENDIVTVNLDTTGKSLHKRGYRDLSVEAPMKETLASAIIELSIFNKDKAMIDAFTGSGTFAIEAARYALNIASGIDREFMYQKWENCDSKYYDLAKQEAEDNVIYGQKLRINAFDIDKNCISIARHHAENARVKDYIHFQQMDMREISSRYNYGVMFANPPYGERLLKEREIKVLYRDIAKMFNTLDNWSLYLITPYEDFEKVFGKKATKNRKLFNGNIECKLYQYMGKKPPKQIITNNN